MINVAYDPQLKSGKQFSIETDSGTLQHASAQTTLALLRESGMSVREAESAVARAKLQAMNPAT